MAEVKWIKLSTALPDNKKLKQIRTLPNGDSIALMWVFLMCLAGDTNDDGMVYFTSEIPFTDEMLANQFNMDVSTIRLGLATFQKFDMVEVVNDMIHLSAWEKWQATDKLSEMRDQTRERVRRCRERKKLAAATSEDCNVTCNVTVTQGNGTDIDKEKEEDKEYISIVEYLNERAGTKYRPSSAKTKTVIHARMAEGFTIDDFKKVIDNKCADWIGTEWEKFLRPETLFGTKFEGYLNAKPVKRKPVNNGVSPDEDDLAGIF